MDFAVPAVNRVKIKDKEIFGSFQRTFKKYYGKIIGWLIVCVLWHINLLERWYQLLLVPKAWKKDRNRRSEKELLKSVCLISSPIDVVVGGCWIHWLHLWRGVKNSPNESPGYDIFNNLVLRLQELWEMVSTPSLPSLPDPLWSEVVAPDRVQPKSKIEPVDVLTKCKQMTYAKLNCLKYYCLISELCVNKWLVFNWIVSDT